jgi:two-component system LytT family sensor kinase
MSGRSWRNSFLCFSALGLLFTFYYHLDDVSRDRVTHFWIRLIEEMTGCWGAWLLFPGMLWVARHVPLRRIWIYMLATIPFTLLKTTWSWGSREAIFQMLGWGHYDYGHMPTRYLMEYPLDVIGCVMTFSLIYLYDRLSESREREMALTKSQLENLRLQLQPHFLFNALNTISSVMYEDPKRADTMLTRLADLLRFTLRENPGPEITLGEEMQALELYLEIMRERFGDQLAIDLNFDPGARQSMVPQLILQPLVENAIKHGSSAEGLYVGVAAHRENGVLTLEVRDHGSGIKQDPRLGIGLKNTIERLRRLYGQAQQFTMTNAETGGLQVTMRIPDRQLEEAAL